MCGRSKKAKDEKAAAKKEGKKAPVVSKQAKDAARKKAAAAMRDVVARQGKAYDRVVREMDRDQYREYVLSVRHAPPAGEAPEPTLSDWLPICEVVVADKQAYEVSVVGSRICTFLRALSFSRSRQEKKITKKKNTPVAHKSRDCRVWCSPSSVAPPPPRERQPAKSLCFSTREYARTAVLVSPRRRQTPRTNQS